uniref:Uncharacterized protein LOC107261466 n=1 Tax=Rhizophora mucronata TaxID=61149 RepID=A0A2P2JP50_RHIMU
MIQLCVNGTKIMPVSALSAPLPPTPRTCPGCNEQKPRIVRPFAAKSAGFSFNSIPNGCQKCGGKGAIECPGCKVST